MIHHWLLQCAGGYSETWRNTRVASWVQEEHTSGRRWRWPTSELPSQSGRYVGPDRLLAEDRGGDRRFHKKHRGHQGRQLRTPSWRSWARCRTIYTWQRLSTRTSTLCRAPRLQHHRTTKRGKSTRERSKKIQKRADRIPCQHSSSWVTHERGMDDGKHQCDGWSLHHSFHNLSSVEKNTCTLQGTHIFFCQGIVEVDVPFPFPESGIS